MRAKSDPRKFTIFGPGKDLEEVDKLAAKLGRSRSSIYQQAWEIAKEVIRKQGDQHTAAMTGSEAQDG